MNIFYTNECPIQTALDHNTIHRNKMIVEHLQMLATAHSELDGNVVGYKPTHKNHPSAIWIRQSVEHYKWVVRCTEELCKLYTDATGKVHASQEVLRLLSTPPKAIPNKKFCEPPVAAPDQFKAVAIFQSATIAYQKYLCSKYAEWQQRDKPLKVEWTHRVPSWYNAQYSVNN